jgi:hypothetical protein
MKLVALAGENPSGEAVAAIQHSLCAKLGEGIVVHMQLVAEIPAGPTGKFRPYFSPIAPRKRLTIAASPE